MWKRRLRPRLEPNSQESVKEVMDLRQRADGRESAKVMSSLNGKAILSRRLADMQTVAPKLGVEMEVKVRRWRQIAKIRSKFYEASMAKSWIPEPRHTSRKQGRKQRCKQG